MPARCTGDQNDHLSHLSVSIAVRSLSKDLSGCLASQQKRVAGQKVVCVQRDEKPAQPVFTVCQVWYFRAVDATGETQDTVKVSYSE